MAYSRIDFARIGGFDLNASIVQFLDALKERAARYAVYRQTVSELSSCSDRELADLGFHRSEIPRIAKEAARLV